MGWSGVVAGMLGMSAETLQRALCVAVQTGDADLASRARAELRTRGMVPAMPRRPRRVRAVTVRWAVAPVRAS